MRKHPSTATGRLKPLRLFSTLLAITPNYGVLSVIAYLLVICPFSEGWGRVSLG